MKKLLFLTVPILSGLLFCNLSAQNVNDDVLLLQKSNALLKIRLNEQRQTLLKQIQTTDSIISLLQSTTAEIKKSADNQNSITQSVYRLEEQTTNTSQVLSNISDAFGKRKIYAIIAIIGSLFIVLIYFFYLKKKLSVINKDIKQNEENANKKISQMNEYLDREIAEVKGIFEKHTIENKAMLTKQVADNNERINKMNNEVNKTIESQILSVKGIFDEQLSKSANKFSEKITELNKTVEKKIATIKNALGTNN